MPDKSRFARALDALAAVAMIAASITVAWVSVSPRLASARAPARGIPPDPVLIDDAPSEGDPKASVVIVQFSDFECPFCARFASVTLPTLRAQYINKGIAQLLFLHLPLEKHPFAVAAAQAAECARSVGRFWPMHDALFAEPRFLDRSSLETRGILLSMNPEVFRRCLDGEQFPRLQRDKALADQMGIRGTPVFLFGRRTRDRTVEFSARLDGAKAFVDFAKILDRLGPTSRNPAR